MRTDIVTVAGQIACVGILVSSGNQGVPGGEAAFMEPPPAATPVVIAGACEELTSDEVAMRLQEEMHKEVFNCLAFRDLLCYAMDKQYVELREVAKSVVEYLLNLEDDMETTWFAMLAVRAFGEPQQYFWTWAYSYRDMPRAASHALCVLGGEAAEGLEGVLEEIRVNTNSFNDQLRAEDRLLAQCTGRVQLVLEANKEYQALQEATDKACFLLGHGCDGYALGEGGTVYDPTGTGCLSRRWARYELNRFGQKEPQAVADAFAKLGPRNWPLVWEHYKNASENMWLQVEKELPAFLYPFLPEEIKALVG